MSVRESLRRLLHRALETMLWLMWGLVIALFMFYGLGHSMIRQALALRGLPSRRATQRRALA
jgi:hypothetical protein